MVKDFKEKRRELEMRISALDIQRPEELEELRKKLDNLEERVRGGETTCNVAAELNT